jgi:hypothetical protein
MPTERSCLDCKHCVPYAGVPHLRETYARCISARREAIAFTGKNFVIPSFAANCRQIEDMCGPTGKWWERRMPDFVPVEEQLSWDDEDDEEED